MTRWLSEEPRPPLTDEELDALEESAKERADIRREADEQDAEAVEEALALIEQGVPLRRLRLQLVPTEVAAPVESVPLPLAAGRRLPTDATGPASKLSWPRVLHAGGEATISLSREFAQVSARLDTALDFIDAHLVRVDAASGSVESLAVFTPNERTASLGHMNELLEARGDPASPLRGDLELWID